MHYLVPILTAIASALQVVNAGCYPAGETWRKLSAVYTLVDKVCDGVSRPNTYSGRPVFGNEKTLSGLYSAGQTKGICENLFRTEAGPPHVVFEVSYIGPQHVIDPADATLHPRECKQGLRKAVRCFMGGTMEIGHFRFRADPQAGACPMSIGCYSGGISWSEINPQDVEEHVWDVCHKWLGGNYTAGQTKGVCQIMNGALGLHALFQVHWTGSEEMFDSDTPDSVGHPVELDPVACMQGIRLTIPPTCDGGGTSFHNGFWFRGDPQYGRWCPKDWDPTNVNS